MRQRVGYVRGDDGVQLAWSEIGRGKPLVRAATWMTHLQYDLESPVWAHWLRFLGGHFRAVRYDERGCGMSDWNTGDLDASHWLGDLEQVVDAAHVDEPMVLLGISQGASTAIRYAVCHPERVSHLVLYGGYAAGCYAFFLATFLYAIAFVAGLDIVPRHIDNGPTAALPLAIGIDAALLLLFAVQHSGMARPGFKRWWKRIVPEPVERATYVLASTLVLALLMWQWRSLPQVIWQVGAEAARIAIYALCASGWLLLLYSTFLINHFDLFGLRQAWFHATGRRPDPHVPFVARAFYRVVRHPLMLGFLIAFWSAPTMSVGHLLFAIATTGYILIAVKYLEERDLVAIYGDTYREYQRRVPMLLPFGRRKATRRKPQEAC